MYVSEETSLNKSLKEKEDFSNLLDFFFHLFNKRLIQENGKFVIKKIQR